MTAVPESWQRPGAVVAPPLELGRQLQVVERPAPRWRKRRRTYEPALGSHPDRFVRLPEEVLLDPELSDGAVRLYGRLYRRASWRPSLDARAGTIQAVAVGQLVADARASDRTVRRWLEELRRAGHITTTGRNGGRLTITLVWVGVHPQAVDNEKRGHG